MAARKIEYLAEINCAIGLTGNLTRNDPKRPKCVDNGLCLSLKYAEGVHKFQPRVLQPWVNDRPRRRTLKEFARCLANAFSVS